jgi:hypothetical protein
MYVLKLVNKLDVRKTDYQENYFPRKFRYKKDAVLVDTRLKIKFGVKTIIVKE